MKARSHFLLLTLLLGLDHTTKYLVEHTLSFYTEIPILSGLSLIKVHNFGAAYGILQNHPSFLLSISFSVLLFGWIYRHNLAQGTLGYIGLTVIASGALGNLIDRLFRGYVVDFLDIHIIPVFNIADILINIGILCLVIDTIRSNNARKTH